MEFSARETVQKGVRMKRDYRGILIMSDLDGTFMGDDGKLVPRNLEALARFRAGGGLFSFATGRVHTTIEQFLLPGWRELINCPAIMCNGACVYDPIQEQVLMETSLDGKCIRSAVSKLFHSGLFSVTNFYADGDYTCYHNVAPEDIASDHWHKAVFLGTSENVCIGKQLLSEEGSHDYRFFRTAPTLLEILPSDGGKGPMLNRLKDYYKAQNRSVLTIGVGDYENDLDLLQCADIGIAPANALDEVKQAADRIVCSNCDGAIADIIDAIDRGELL